MNRATFRAISFVIVAMTPISNALTEGLNTTAALEVTTIGNSLVPPHHHLGRGALIPGLDGGLYEGYRPGTIERVQLALKARELYSGPVNGILDEPTIQAIYAFQKMTRTLQVCGIPTPRTRKLLEQGSHTDP
jgi:hypothetical protein